MLRFLIVSIVSVCSSSAFGAPSTEPVTDGQTVFKQPIEGQVALEVHREQLRDLKPLYSVLPPDAKNAVVGASNISVVLRSETGRAVLLASRLEVRGRGVDGEFHVVGFDFERGEVALALTLGSELALWRIPVGFEIKDDSWEPLQGWEVLQEATPLVAGSVKVEMSRGAGGARRITVYDLRAGDASIPPTVYIQAGQSWHFELESGNPIRNPSRKRGLNGT